MMLIWGSIRSHRILAAVAVIVLQLFAASALLAVQYNGEETYTYHQPDGSTFEVKLYGDEFYAVAETLDGYVVTRDAKTGDFCYAKLNAAASNFESTGIKLGKAIPAKAAVPRHARLSREGVEKASKAMRQYLGVDDRGLLLPELGRQLRPREHGFAKWTPALDPVMDCGRTSRPTRGADSPPMA